MDEPSTNKPGLWQLISQIYTEHGLVVLTLVVLLGFMAFLVWNLIWKVWSNAMKAKDEEIARVSKERDKYQALVFDRLRTSEVAIAQTEEKPVAVVRRDHGNTQ